MKQIQIIAPEYVYSLWPILEDFFERSAAESTNDSTADQIKTSLARGSQILFGVIDENEKLVGAFSVELINYPNHRVAQTTGMGGKGLFDENTIKQYEDWCRTQGCTKIRAWAKDAQARLYRMKLGLEKSMNVVEKLL
jgi:hypothetical protein